jgi:hypothetical protein
MSAAKKAERPIVCVPCALKCFYLDDPTPRLAELMTRLEESIHWRPRPDLPLYERLYRFAEGLLALKELEHLGTPQSGPLRDRTLKLADTLLARLEARHKVPNKGGIVPERVKEVRRAVIKAVEQNGQAMEVKQQLVADMEDLFFIVQLFSYPGDYVAERATIERIAETLDKFEEDVLRADYPGIRGTRRAVVRFGEPITVPKEREAKGSVEQWTDLVESRVQGLLDEINADVGSLDLTLSHGGTEPQRLRAE